MIWILIPVALAAGVILGYTAAVARTANLLASMSAQELRTLARRVSARRH